VQVAKLKESSHPVRKSTRFLLPRIEKLRVAVDVDGVLAETMEAWVKTFNKLHGTRFKLKDIDSWASWIKFGISKDEFYRILDGTWDNWIDIPPTEPDLASKVQRAERYGVLDIVTGRSPRTVPAVKQWLKNQEIKYNRFVRVLGWRYKIALGYDVYIDDAPEMMPMISRAPGIFGILYQRPWNMDVLDLPQVFKVRTWSQIPTVLKEIIDTKKEIAA
jgi:5'(3')-deoxyribonucleotidase